MKLALVLVAVGLCSAVLAANGKTPDYYSLSLQYPGTICATLQKPSCKIPYYATGNFTIHGLWPDSFSGDNPFDCQSIPFDMNALDPIRSQLNVDWTDYLDDPQGFYSHEWSKHGTCSYDVPNLSVVNYFKFTLNLYNRFSLINLLAKGGIVPDDSKLYSVHDFVGAIQSNLGVKIELYCHKTGVLGEVRICFDKQFNFMDCPTASRTASCGSEIHLPIVHKQKNL